MNTENKNNMISETDATPTHPALIISDIHVFVVYEPGTSEIKALVSFVINGCFEVRGVRVMEGANGLYIAYPKDPYYKGEINLRDICTPITSSAREQIETAILEAYQMQCDKCK